MKLATQNHNTSNRANLSRAVRKIRNRSLILDLAETSNSLEEICDDHSPTPVLIDKMTSRRGNNNKSNGNGNKNAFFYKDHVIPKENYEAFTPEIK